MASEADAATLNAALAADTNFTVGDESNGRASVAQDPSAAPSAPASPSTPAADAEAAPTAPATEAPVSTLPSTISGQTAAEETCSVGNG